MEKKAFQILIGTPYSDYEKVILPIEENVDHECLDSYKELKEKWLNMKWGYYGEIIEMKQCEIPEQVTDPTDTVTCPEFNIVAYKELAIESDLYNTPYDNCPELNVWYSCYYAYSCMKGEIYSKDFAYNYCEHCGRNICMQNPSNGWHSQVRTLYEGGDFICTRCFDEIILEQGINEFWNGDMNGNFFGDEELERYGWKEEFEALVGSGYRGYKDPKETIERIQQLIDSGKKVLINYDSLSIGGLGGYITIFTKAA